MSARVTCALRPVRSISVAISRTSRCAERCAKEAVLTSFRATFRTASGVYHPESDVAEVGKLSAKTALGQIEGSILSNSKNW